MFEKLNAKIEKFENYINRINKEKKMVGVSVAFSYDNEIIYAKGFGKARLNSKQNITPNTIMSIQSITKSFASTSIMHLVEKGLIDLDKPLVHYLPYFRTSKKEESDKITVRELLSHTAGFPSDILIANIICPNIEELKDLREMQKTKGISDDVRKDIKSFEDITRYFKNVDLDYKPGEGFKYCTDAYVIVGDLFEKVSGISWYDFLQKNIFDKLNMTRTTLEPLKAINDKDSARYYTYDDSSFKEVSFPTNKIAAPIGFIYSTALDMSKYLVAHMDYKNATLLKSISLREMQNSYTRVNDVSSRFDVKNPGYGLGWCTGMYKGLNLVEHSGGYPGVKSFVRMITNKKVGIVCLTNFQETNVIEICNKATDILLDV